MFISVDVEAPSTFDAIQTRIIGNPAFTCRFRFTKRIIINSDDDRINQNLSVDGSVDDLMHPDCPVQEVNDPQDFQVEEKVETTGFKLM